MHMKITKGASVKGQRKVKASNQSFSASMVPALIPANSSQAERRLYEFFSSLPLAQRSQIAHRIQRSAGNQSLCKQAPRSQNKKNLDFNHPSMIDLHQLAYDEKRISSINTNILQRKGRYLDNLSEDNVASLRSEIKLLLNEYRGIPHDDIDYITHLNILTQIIELSINNDNESAEDRKPTIFDISLFKEFEYVFDQQVSVALEKKTTVSPDIIGPRSRGQPMKGNARMQSRGNHVIGTRSSDEIRNEEFSLILDKSRDINNLSFVHHFYISKFKRRFPNIKKEILPGQIANEDDNNIIVSLIILALFIIFVIFHMLNQEKWGK